MSKHCAFTARHRWVGADVNVHDIVLYSLREPHLTHYLTDSRPRSGTGSLSLANRPSSIASNVARNANATQSASCGPSAVEFFAQEGWHGLRSSPRCWRNSARLDSEEVIHVT